MRPYIFAHEASNDGLMDDKTIIGARIRSRRLELGAARGKRFTHAELGKLVGLDAQVVSKHERGKIGLSADSLIKYADALQTTAESLAGEATAEKPGPKPELRVVRGAGAGVPWPILNLLNAAPRLSPLSDEEVDHLSRHLDDPNSSKEPIDLEIVLLAYRAHRSLTDAAAAAFKAALVRKRKLKQKQKAIPAKNGSPEQTHRDTR